jgi:hypothetical protein
MLLFAGALALIGHTAAVTGLIKALMTRRRRNRRADKEACELMLVGATLIVIAVLLAAATL